MGSNNKRPWLLAALVARELELLVLPVPLPLDTPLPAWPCRAICCCCRRIWISEEVRPSEVSGIEATDIWSRQRHAPTSLGADQTRRTDRRAWWRKVEREKEEKEEGASNRNATRMGGCHGRRKVVEKWSAATEARLVKWPLHGNGRRASGRP
jgi:hypothetical protein